MYKAVEQTLEDVTQADCAEETKEANNPKIRKMPELPLPALAPNVNTQPESVKRQRMQISTLCNDEEIVFQEQFAKKHVETFVSVVSILPPKQEAAPAKEPTYTRKFKNIDPKLKAMLGVFSCNKTPRSGSQPVSVGNNPNSLFGKILFDIPTGEKNTPLPSLTIPTPENEERYFRRS